MHVFLSSCLTFCLHHPIPSLSSLPLFPPSLHARGSDGGGRLGVEVFACVTTGMTSWGGESARSVPRFKPRGFESGFTPHNAYLLRACAYARQTCAYASVCAHVLVHSRAGTQMVCAFQIVAHVLALLCTWVSTYVHGHADTKNLSARNRVLAL